MQDIKIIDLPHASSAFLTTLSAKNLTDSTCENKKSQLNLI
jgi:hypothetical protein